MSVPDPVVSIIIPAYNAAGFIARSVQSALAQSYSAIEVVVVDDGSSDGTVGEVQRISALDPRVRLVRTPRNLGPAGARNLGISAARGDWIALLDADDAYDPRRIETLMVFAGREGADMIADNLLLDEEGGGAQPMLPPSLLPGPKRVDACAFLEGNLPIRGHPRVSYGFLKPMMRRQFLLDHELRYDEEIRFAEDFLMYVNCLLAGARFWLLPEPLYSYRIRGDSLTASHGADELRRLHDAARSLMQRKEVRRDQRLRNMLRRHARSVEERLAWRVFTDRIKEGNPLGALGAFMSLRSTLHIARECVLFTRKIPAKIARMRRAGTPQPAR
ncbi:glycosyltransferase family 2 protein [Indioceanicola profundi]|uniref:glycosyltransferase family 2 protein n=1 Tax=Indioceanicola profundi TaxID=2220096 RepID=UPI0013C407E8|nr:glycosyltransferase family 2 protein [Indioceanicola profundi]